MARPRTTNSTKIPPPPPRENNRAETAQACAKTRNFELPLLLATDPEIRQHLIFSSFDDVILRSFCSVVKNIWNGTFLWVSDVVRKVAGWDVSSPEQDSHSDSEQNNK